MNIIIWLTKFCICYFIFIYKENRVCILGVYMRKLFTFIRCVYTYSRCPNRFCPVLMSWIVLRLCKAKFHSFYEKRNNYFHTEWNTEWNLINFLSQNIYNPSLTISNLKCLTWWYPNVRTHGINVLFQRIMIPM